LNGDEHHAHLPVWARMVRKKTNKVLLLDMDGSSLGSLFNFPDISQDYKDAALELGLNFQSRDIDQMSVPLPADSHGKFNFSLKFH
jgi:hypothetical protein